MFLFTLLKVVTCYCYYNMLFLPNLTQEMSDVGIYIYIVYRLVQ